MKPSREPTCAIPDSHPSTMKVDNGRHRAVTFGCRWVNINIEGYVSNFLVGYGGGGRFCHR
jgi:hypothetical protein